MAKEKERRIAYDMFVNRGKSGKEIAQLLEVSEKTISGWVSRYGWKQEREARVNSAPNGLENIRRVISNLAEQRLLIDEQRKEALEAGDQKAVFMLDKEAASLADQVSKMNKALENMDKNNRISLSVYLDVMDDVFASLRSQDEKLYLQTLDFQESHAQFISKKLG